MEWVYRSPAYRERKQKDYIRYFAGCENVLDIGCGRGDFVEMLVDAGIGAHGVEVEPNAVAYAQQHGRPVQMADALTYVGGLSDASLDGVFMAQAAEHMTPSYLVSLLELCHRKTKAGAPLVVETINPVSVWALTNWYLIDPTHIRPIHPDTLKFTLESTGFSDVEIRYLSPVAEGDKLGEVPRDESVGVGLEGMIAQINSNVKRLNDFLYGFQEYVAIAHRASDSLETDNHPARQPEAV
jgi:O-antigen chain-terminating methyltransferase